MRSAIETPKPTYSSSPVGPAKRLAEWITCGKPRLRAQMRVQVWPPPPASSVTVTMMGTPVAPRDVEGAAGGAPGGRRPADQARGLGDPPADVAEADLVDHTDIDDAVAIGDAFRKTSPRRQRQPAPILVRQQRAETAIVEQFCVSEGRCVGA